MKRRNLKDLSKLKLTKNVIIPFPNFQQNTIISPTQMNDNFEEIEYAYNNLIDNHNGAIQNLEDALNEIIVSDGDTIVNEEGRVKNEEIRKANEEERKTNEANRQTEETKRIATYNTHMNDETKRQQTHREMVSAFNDKVVEVQNAINAIPSKEELKGEQGVQGERGERGEKGEKGDKGDKGDRGEKGEKGEDGSIIFEELTPEQKATLKGDKGDKGDRGEPGVSIHSITEYYQVSTSNTVAPSSWLTTAPALTPTNKYLWNYRRIDYTDGSAIASDMRVIGVYGERGEKGEKGDKGDKGDKGEKGDTISISLNGTTYTDNSGLITLPNYPNTTSLETSVREVEINLRQVQSNINSLQKIYYSTSEPTATQGKDGDLWIIYEG